MRILLVTNAFPPDGIAGVERYTQALAAQLVQRGDVVGVVSRKDGDRAAAPSTVSERLRDGVSVYRLAGGRRTVDRFLAHHERLEELFGMVLQETKPEVVHFNHLIGHSPRFIEIAHRHRAAVIVTLHDYYYACPLVQLRRPSGELCNGPDGGRECARACFAHEGANAKMRWAFRALYFRRLLQEAERVITPSRYVGSYFEQFGVDAGRLHLLPYGIPYDAAERLARNPPPSRTRHSLNLAFFGSVVQHKGVHVIIEALATAAMESVNFTVFGPIPSYERQYVQNIRDRAASIRGLKLRMYGSYEPDELGCLYQDIDCIIVPSQWQEAFGLVVLEAFVSGVPVVASRVGGLPELVEEERNGLLFQHDHPEQLAAILRRLAADDLLLQRLQEGARLTPVRTMAEHAEEVRSVYQQAVADFANNGEPKWGAAQELDLIYSTLVDLGASRTDEASAPAP